MADVDDVVELPRRFMTAESACSKPSNCLIHHLGFERELDLLQWVRATELFISEPIQYERMVAVIVGVTTPRVLRSVFAGPRTGAPILFGVR